MSTEYMELNDQATLARRLVEGPLPVADALRYAMHLADSLRKLHDGGRVHGAVTTSNLSLAAGGVELLAAPEGSGDTITPYTAPEVVMGHAADARSDIFGFGAILFEMFTGRRAFEGEGRVALTASLTQTPTPASGSPAVDRLVGPCLAKNPDARTPRMQKVMMELKLLSVAARRAEPGAAGTRRRDTAVETEVRRAEMQQLEARIAGRLRAHEDSVHEVHQLANDAISSLRKQVAAMNSELAANHQQSMERKGLDEAANEVILSRVDRGFETLNVRIAQIERGVEDLRKHTTQFEQNMAADLVDIEQHVKAQSVSIESARTAIAQTDDLVERVVEALESLQTAVLDEGGVEHASAAAN